MDKEKLAEQPMMIQLTFCRICAVLSSEENCIYETTYKDGTLSMHAMMEKMVPSVFNAEQVKIDEFMSFPTKVCGRCKNKVLDAYGLYEQCLRSGDLLRESLACKKSATFIVNITGCGVDSAEGNLLLPLEPEETVEVSRMGSSKSPTVVETAKEKIVPEERDGDEAMELVPILYGEDNEEDHTAIVSENEALLEERAIISTSEVNTEAEEVQKPRTRATAKRKKILKPRNASKLKQNVSGNVLEDTEKDAKVNEIQFRCLHCDGARFSSPEALTKHVKKEHLDQIFCCNLCPKVFMTKAASEHHQFCHSTGRSFFCTLCDKGFQSEQLLKNHLRTHTHSTGFLCSQCGKEFSDRSNLRQHEYRHTGDKPWACKMCPSRFSTKGYLTVHLATHKKTKSFSCDTCGSQFSRHYSLVKHQLIHTGERHYACEVCQMRFTSAYHLKMHMRTHTGEKPYKCGRCSRGFAQKNDMLKHITTHGKPFPCDRCQASFQSVVDLRLHLNEHERAKRLEKAASSAEHKSGLDKVATVRSEA